MIRLEKADVAVDERNRKIEVYMGDGKAYDANTLEVLSKNAVIKSVNGNYLKTDVFGLVSSANIRSIKGYNSDFIESPLLLIENRSFKPDLLIRPDDATFIYLDDDSIYYYDAETDSGISYNEFSSEAFKIDKYDPRNLKNKGKILETEADFIITEERRDTADILLNLDDKGPELVDPEFTIEDFNTPVIESTPSGLKEPESAAIKKPSEKNEIYPQKPIYVLPTPIKPIPISQLSDMGIMLTSSTSREMRAVNITADNNVDLNLSKGMSVYTKVASNKDLGINVSNSSLTIPIKDDSGSNSDLFKGDYVSYWEKLNQSGMKISWISSEDDKSQYIERAKLAFAEEINHKGIINPGQMKGEKLKAFCYLLGASANEIGSKSNDAYYQNIAIKIVKGIQVKYGLNRNSKDERIDATGNTNHSVYTKIVDEYMNRKLYTAPNHVNLRDVSVIKNRDYQSMGLLNSVRFGFEDGLRQVAQDWINTGAAIDDLANLASNPIDTKNFMNAALSVVFKFQNELSTSIKSGNLLKIGETVLNAMVAISPQMLICRAFIKPIIESYTDTIKEDSMRGANPVYSGVKLATRLILDFASIGGIASTGIRVGKSTVELGTKVAKKLATTIDKSVIKSTIDQSTNLIMKQLMGKDLILDNLKSGVKKETYELANHMRSFLGTLVFETDSVFEMILKTTYEAKSKTISLLNKSKRVMSFNKDELIKYVKQQHPDEEATSIVNTLMGACFTASTLVLTNLGYKPICEINDGDQVLSKNIETGEESYQIVLNTYEKETDKTIVINMGNDKIETTENHLFFVKDNWWRAASNLKPGDLIETNNESCLVTEINVITTSKPIRVYNLNVDVNHNYYVGKNNCLVHNNCSQSQIDLYRSQSKSTISKFKSSIENSIDDIASQINKVYYRSEYEVRLELVGGFRHKIVINNEIPETLRIRFNEIIDEKLLEGAGNLIDDAAEALMDGAQYTKVGRIKALKPNISYKSTGGHLYKTDSLGRIDSVEGTLKLGAGKRNDYAQKVAGRGDRLADDHGGHLIASIFEGSGDLDNLVPMNGNLNQSAWKTMENEWAKALGDGKKVNVMIDTVYNGNSMRPTKFLVEYSIDGQIVRKSFNNVAGG